ncbi:MAG TPA: hypothetical protein VF505_16955 [Thermoanaerobaculia bacterium]
MELLRTPPPALTGLQRRLVGLTAVVVALTRVWARSRSLWDWDEALFSIAVGNYDVVLHHPHPPGFPLYIALAKLIRVFVHSDFHSLQAITTIAAVTLFPLLFWLARELRFPFRTAFLGSLLFVFFPNVWFFGGTAFSDIPGLALLIAASATLLRSCRHRNSYFAGALLLGLAAAIRPQALVVGCAPALIASWCRVKEKRAKDVFTASAIGIAVLAVSYGGAALASQSVEGYIEMNGMLRQYVRNVDSFLNPGRPPVISLFPDFFVHAIPGGHIPVAISALAATSIIASLLRRTPRVWILVAMFLPFNIIGWFMLDTNSISRYSVGYAAMYAILAVDGIDALLLVVTRQRSLLAVAALEAMLVIASIASLFWWTLPALRDTRHTVSPPFAAMEWIHANVPRSGRLYVRTNMQPFSDYMLRDHDVTLIEDPSELPQRPVSASDWFVSEGSSAVVGAHNFVRDRGHLFDIARQRYFEASVVPMTSVFRFGAGWYGGENVGLSSWRWMSGHSKTLLPPIVGNARLTMGFDIPSEMVSRHPTIEIQLNGVIVDRFVCSTPSMTKSWLVPARADAWNQLVISMDKVLNPAKEGITPDARDLGLDLTSYSWGPAGTP